MTVTSSAHGPLQGQIDALSLQIAEAPDDAMRFLARGELYRLDGNSPAAEADYDAAERLDPALRGVWVCRAHLWYQRGQLPEALSAVGRFLVHEPRDDRALLLRADILAALGRYGEAIEAMDLAIENSDSPGPAHYLGRARLIIETDNASVDRALAGLDEGIARLGPVESLSWYAIEICRNAGFYDRALARIDELSEVCARTDILLARRGNILQSAGRQLEAMVAYTACLDAIDALPASAIGVDAVRHLRRDVSSELEKIQFESQ